MSLKTQSQARKKQNDKNMYGLKNIDLNWAILVK